MSANVDDIKIARRYARALFEQAEQEGRLDAVASDLHAVADILNDVGDLKVFLENPGIAKVAKIDFLNQEIADKVDTLVARVLALMLENDRIGVVSALAEKYQSLLDTRNNVGHATITSASELSESLKEKLSQTLCSRYGYQNVVLESQVDPTILGGAVVRVGDDIIDGSFRGRLNALKKQLV